MRRRLRPPVQDRRRDADHPRRRPEASGRAHRPRRRAAHLGLGAHPPSPRPRHRARRRGALDRLQARLLPARARAAASLPQALSRRPRRAQPGRPPGLLRRPRPAHREKRLRRRARAVAPVRVAAAAPHVTSVLGRPQGDGANRRPTVPGLAEPPGGRSRPFETPGGSNNCRSQAWQGWVLLPDCQPGPHMVCCPPEIWRRTHGIGAASRSRPSPERQEEQRRSFVYGNTHLENPLITRAMIAEEAEAIARERDRRRE